mmetsp:Transcript_16641/g.32252  ORF Transcript_16641/g.32252 Transcript_16641/m.32252 type:complete len:559 (-) Transcript_16641:670-2346(-)|eukprot:CAMPEP_0171502336 /NCGR_PEP_ID=MMETSP0958-20121227/10109_1 /TAXON_ID=87120 /ORGANISM="Aurantiochytrium limacinum, Strain ATCCMYA-1381" /LENGTH=558 /DNA_ID=CAMNT_0012037355 /DNA_START=21 /DNA_END=1697 /DNA_ORIENTATION=+
MDGISSVLPSQNGRCFILQNMLSTFYLMPLTSMILNAGVAALLCLASVDITADDVQDLMPPSCHACVLFFSGSASDAHDLLGMVSSACISISTLTFSLTVVAIQLASVNYSPRLLDEFLKDPISKQAFAINLGTWVYCYVVRNNVYVATDEVEGFVPIIAVNVLALHVAAVMCNFIYFIQYFVNSLRLESILVKAADSAWSAVLRLRLLDDTDEETHLPDVPAGAHRALADSSGYVSSFCFETVLNQAVNLDVIVRYACHNGEFVTEGTLLAWIWPRDGDHSALEKRINENYPQETDKLPFAGSMQTHVTDQQRAGNAKNHIARVLWKLANDGVVLSATRSRENDVSLGVQQLADIATRALSPGVNDPQTAIQAMDSLSVVFSRLTVSKFSRNASKDSDKCLRLVAPVRGFAFLLSICMESIRCYGAGDAKVVRRAMYFLGDIGAIAARVHHQDRASVVKDHIHQWYANAEASFGTSSVEYGTITEVYEHALHLIDTAPSARVPENEDPKHHNDEALEGHIQDSEDEEEKKEHNLIPSSLPQPVAEVVNKVSHLTTLV